MGELALPLSTCSTWRKDPVLCLDSTADPGGGGTDELPQIQVQWKAASTTPLP